MLKRGIQNKMSVAGWISISKNLNVIFFLQQQYEHHFRQLTLDLCQKIATKEG